MRERLIRLIDWFRRDSLDRELTEELQFHRQQLEREAIARDSSLEHARYGAQRRLGSTLRAREDARERWSWPRADQFFDDLKYAFRTLRRSPSSSATVVVTMALGIGANVAMLSVIDQMMYRPMPYLRDADAVHRVYLHAFVRDKRQLRSSMEYVRYTDIRDGTTSFSLAAVFAEPRMAIGAGEDARERKVGAVSASFFTFFDAAPILGRYFVEAEDKPPLGASVIVLSEAMWQAEFGSRNVIGERLRVGNIDGEIIGVAPAGLSVTNETDPPSLFVPITAYAGTIGSSDATTYYQQYYWGFVNMMVRRKPGVSEAQATADLTQAFVRSWAVERSRQPSIATLEIAKPTATAGAVKPWAGPDPALEARTAKWIAGITVIVLMIACANVINLALARALRRQRETAVRLALGAKRSRLVVQSIVEGMVLTTIAAFGALLVAGWVALLVKRMLRTAAVATPPQFEVDWRMFGMATVLAIIVGLATGMFPALLSQRGNLSPALRGGSRGGGSHRTVLRSALLVTQGALTVVMLVGAALFMRSLSAVRALPMGYTADNVLRVNRIERGDVTNTERVALRQRLLEAAQSLPEVRAASWVSSTPFISTSTTRIFVAGIDSVAALGQFTYQATTPDYFRVMNTRITRGRGFTDVDRAGTPRVAVVSQGMATAIWPGRDAIGQCMRLTADTMPCTTVVGIAEDMVQQDLEATQRYHYYVPIEQFTRTHGNGLLLLLRGDPAIQGESVRRALQKSIPGASYLTVQPLSDIVANAQRSWRMGAALLMAFGGLALLVAAVGLYGVLNYNVAQRMHELGVRSALGATPGGIMRLVVGQSLKLILLGIVSGAALAVAGSRWVQPLLFRQSATDPLVYAGVAAIMIIVAITASALPAMLASRADPNSALRVE